jgi:hypothetical protein
MEATVDRTNQFGNALEEDLKTVRRVNTESPL